MAIFLVACPSSTPNEEVSAPLGKPMNANNPDFLASVFNVFDNVETRYDGTYFYVSSNGLPDHNMMVGITSWRQQVPIQHNYTRDNSWAIPLQPVLANTPLSTKTNFMKGAIAIAANGIPIFNPLNNRGVDSFVEGELDQLGGHCGRGDDYHYHLPPTHLQKQVGEGKPIAYALDGFPIYGKSTQQLDDCLGQFDPDTTTYQYHAVDQYPYLIAAMKGRVSTNPKTRAPENEISPQAHTRGVRPDKRPLKGAKITKFEKLNLNHFSLTYVLDDEEHMIDYSWSDDGVYQFKFIDADGSITSETHKQK